MISAALQLFRPLRYLCVRGAGKRVIDIFLPVVFAALSAALLTSVSSVHVLAPLGLIDRVNGLLQVMVGFFVASLAAVATFPSPALDQNVLNLSLNDSALRRRQFLSYLFGYLSLCSFALYVTGTFAILCAAAFKPVAALRWLRGSFVFVYLFLLWNIFFVTLLGLYYLVDRIHRPDVASHQVDPVHPKRQRRPKKIANISDAAVR